MSSRYWSFIVYPESVIDDWVNVLCQMGLVFAVSPLHDKDINPDKSIKKPHFHVLVEFDGPKRYKNIKEDVCDVIHSTIPQKVQSLRGYYRYFCHLDNPEKYQYDPSLIACYGGFNLDLTTSEVNQLMSDIIARIESENISEYRDLVLKYLYEGSMDEFDIVSHHTIFFDKYLTSRRNLFKKGCIKKES